MEAIVALPTDENGKLITLHNYQKRLSKYIVYLRDWLAVDVVQKEEKHKKKHMHLLFILMRNQRD